jgi:hypothetical protein
VPFHGKYGKALKCKEKKMCILNVLFYLQITVCVIITCRLCLDADIGRLGIKLSLIPNQTSFGNGLNTKAIVWM